MCGRYTLIKLADFIDIFPWIHLPDEVPASRFNVAPTQQILVVPNDGSDKLQFFHWGLIPSWAKDPSIGNRMINARAETLATKPAFRSALARRRCLIVADGFYEWQKLPDGKSRQPMYIRMRSHAPFAFAGLWEMWRDPEGNEVPSCTIITTSPNDLTKTIHDRMPAILKPENYRRWLARSERSAEELSPLLAPFPADEMEAFPVSKRVNSASNEVPECVEPQMEAESSAVGKKLPRRRQIDPAPGLFDSTTD